MPKTELQESVDTMNKAIEELPRGPAGSVQERTRMALITIADAINQVAQKVDPEKG